MSVESIGHQFEFSIWWYERDRPVIFESGESDALMELYVLQLHRLRFPSTSGLKENFVIEPQAEFRHSGQINPHFDSTNYL